MSALMPGLRPGLLTAELRAYRAGMDAGEFAHAGADTPPVPHVYLAFETWYRQGFADRWAQCESVRLAMQEVERLRAIRRRDAS